MMIDLVRHLAVVCAIGLGLAVPAWADEPLHGQVIGVVGGDVITLLDARQREHQLRLAFIDPPVPGQPYAAGAAARSRTAPASWWCGTARGADGC